MEILDPTLDLDRFWDALEAAPARVLLLDYDGTLAPFRDERDEAVPYPEAREAVRGLLEEGHTRVVVISGRAVGDLRPLLGVEPAPEIRGSHGWEVRPAAAPAGGSGSTSTPSEEEPETRLVDLPETASRALARARSAADEADVDPARVERKPASVAFHTRGLPEEEAPGAEGLREEWGGLAEEAGLEVHAFDGGFELRVPGRDKGTAVREVLADEPEGAVVAYLGDDLTDEDAFRALDERSADDPERRARTLTALVRAERRDTAARLRLRPPDELLDFLATWRRRAWTG